MRYMKKAFGLSVIIAGLTAGVHSAEAAIATTFDVHAASAKIQANDDSNASATQSTITAMQNAISEAILQLSGQNTTNSNATMTALSNMAGVQDQRAVMRKIEDAKFQAATNSTSGSSVCNVITGAIKTQNLEALTTAWRTQAVQAQLAASRGYIGGKWAAGEAVRKAAETAHCTSNATQGDVDSGMCSAVTQKATPNSAGNAGTGTVVVPDDENGGVAINNTIITSDQAKAMTGFLYLLENTEPPNPPQPGSAKYDSADGRRRLHVRRASDAHKSISDSILGGLVAQTMVISPAGDTNQSQALSWAEATAGNTEGYAKSTGSYCSASSGSTSCYFPNGISELGVDELRSKSWFYNSNWGVRTGTAGPAEVEKDMAMMMAWQTVQNYKIYRVLREIDWSLASMDSMMAQHEGNEGKL